MLSQPCLYYLFSFLLFCFFSLLIMKAGLLPAKGLCTQGESKDAFRSPLLHLQKPTKENEFVGVNTVMSLCEISKRVHSSSETWGLSGWKELVNSSSRVRLCSQCSQLISVCLFIYTISLIISCVPCHFLKLTSLLLDLFNFFLSWRQCVFTFSFILSQSKAQVFSCTLSGWFLYVCYILLSGIMEAL